MFEENGDKGKGAIIEKGLVKAVPSIAENKKAKRSAAADDEEYDSSVSQGIRATSKLFASHGDHGDYHLNEHDKVESWRVKHNKEHPKDKENQLPPLVHLPSIKGSRQHIMLELAEAIARNR